MRLSNNQRAFLALVSAGLWEKDCRLSDASCVGWKEVWKVALEQAVYGIVFSGIEQLPAAKRPPQDILLQLIGYIQILEHRNEGMNLFIDEHVGRMKEAGIHTLIVKGQGVAQCYGKPLRRSCGDIDFYLDKANFDKARQYFRELVECPDLDDGLSGHIALDYKGWAIELHDSQHTGLSRRVDKVLDEIHDELFVYGGVRVWKNGEEDIYLPSPDNDVVIVFTHFLKHFYKGGLGLRQICDWCRLLWTFRAELDLQLLGRRLRRMGLMSEWKAFASFAVEYLGMPVEAMPFYSSQKRWSREAGRICSFVIRVGNFGHNRDMSYYARRPYVVRKAISFRRRSVDALNHLTIFPLDTLRFFPSIVFNGIRSAIRGEG